MVLGLVQLPKTKRLLIQWKEWGFVGMAFQIKDDIFDYGFSNNIGKPTGIDIKEKANIASNLCNEQG